ncbi:Uma2 family endonuclease [Hymenobacter cheonanensis]|uniref:Uma2 family endonuclease n=1 Tax=Hymenobacter sp. CA2-7 TaxID=3063993 RepID=UPI0027128C30|nr:Uma2 family endonuclease [Hymenobacter sp. CA2-7]MDO7887916.1 Uma2 family endonuclease [Hymenobacter sp. CA2-7]
MPRFLIDVRLLGSPGYGDAQIRAVVQPDLCVVCDSRPSCVRAAARAHPTGLLKLCRPTRLNVATKYDLYTESGMGEYWLVFPKEKVVQALVLAEKGECRLANEFDGASCLPSHTLPELAPEWTAVFVDV